MPHSAEVSRGGHTSHWWWDREFGAALLAAPLCWGVLWIITDAAPEVSWPLRAPWQFMLLALVYPVLEEIVFRGALQGALYQHAWARRGLGLLSYANILASLIFTAFHFIYHPPLAAALVLFPALIFGYFRDKYQRLQPAIALHVFYNTGYFLLFPPNNM